MSISLSENVSHTNMIRPDISLKQTIIICQVIEYYVVVWYGTLYLAKSKNTADARFISQYSLAHLNRERQIHARLVQTFPHSFSKIFKKTESQKPSSSE